MACKERLEAYLREQQVPYQTQHHPTAYTAQEVAASEHVSGNQVAKVVMVIADERLAMLVVPAPYRVDVEHVGPILGAQAVRLAHESEFASAFPDCEVGAMPPFGNLYNLPVFVEQALAEQDTIICPAGSHTDTISLKYADFARLVKPTVASFAHHP